MAMARVVRATILTVTYDDEYKFCSSRVIRAKLKDANGNEYRVNWASTPAVIGPTVTKISKNQKSFDKVWGICKVGEEVYVYHSEDSEFNYFEPIE